MADMQRRGANVVRQHTKLIEVFEDGPALGRPDRSPDRTCATDPLAAAPHDAALFLSAESVLSPLEARVGGRRSAAPKARELYLRGASPPADSIAPGEATKGRLVTAQRFPAASTAPRAHGPQA